MVFVSVFGALEEPGCSYSCRSLQQSIVRAASSRSSTKPEPKPGGIEIAKRVFGWPKIFLYEERLLR